MLVLSRKPNESIRINDNVVVTVLSIRGNKVQLGIDAPGGMPVNRRELHERLQNQDHPINVV
jgi:carbon storage regulator